MKLNKYLVLSLTMTAVGVLCACGDDTDDDVVVPETVDVRDQAVGTYEGKVACLVECEGKLVDISSLIEDQSVLDFSANVTKNGNNAINIEIDGDNIVVSKIAAASNGFLGDIENEFKFDGYTATGYKGCRLESAGSTTERYSAIYVSTNEMLSFFISTEAEAILTMVNEEDKVAVLAKMTGFTEEELEANWESLLFIERFDGQKQ